MKTRAFLDLGPCWFFVFPPNAKKNHEIWWSQQEVHKTIAMAAEKDIGFPPSHNGVVLHHDSSDGYGPRFSW
jgi:hypothetical protein